MSDSLASDIEPDPFEDDEGLSQTCKYCGRKGLFWDQVLGRWKLYDPAISGFHVCPSKLKGAWDELKGIYK
ncbi:MAG TPA: hypothetical protein VIY48_19525 [Candidatus Paceibacterota bacterium]